METQAVAIVLAGGRSSRMGRDKAWLTIDDVPMLQRVVAAVLDARARPIVVGSPGQSLPALPPDATRVDDPPARIHLGPLAGLLTGLEAAGDAELAFVGAADMARLGPAHVRFVLDALAGDPEIDAVVPIEPGPDGGVVQGLGGAVRVRPALAAARTLLAADRRALHRLYEHLRTRRIPTADLPDPRAVSACNTPAELEALRAELGREPASGAP